MAWDLKNADFEASEIDSVPFANGLACHIVSPFEIIDKISLFLFHSLRYIPAEFINRGNGFLHLKDLPSPRGSIDLCPGKAAFEERDDPNMIKVSMEDQDLRD